MRRSARNRASAAPPAVEPQPYGLECVQEVPEIEMQDDAQDILDVVMQDRPPTPPLEDLDQALAEKQQEQQEQQEQQQQEKEKEKEKEKEQEKEQEHQEQQQEGELEQQDQTVEDARFPPAPPSHLFHTIRKLRNTDDTTTWLCLPREFANQCSQGNDDPSYNGRMRRPLLPLSLRKAKCWSIRNDLDSEHIAQAVIVKTSTNSAVLRKHADLLERLHSAGRPGVEAPRFHTQSHFGSYLLEQQLTKDFHSSWLRLRPQFGRTLNQFGWWSKLYNGKPIPAYFIWHVFLSVLWALDIAHGEGIAKLNVTLENICLNLHPVHGRHWFRNWPDVVLVDVSEATVLDDTSKKQDVEGLLHVICHLIDVYGTVKEPKQQTRNKQKGRLDEFAEYARRMLDGDGEEGVTLAALKDVWESVATNERKEGPGYFAQEFINYAHNDMIDRHGLDEALAVSRFGSESSEDFQAWIRARPERSPVVFEKKTDKMADGRVITRAMCIVKISKKRRHLLKDNKLIEEYLTKRHTAESNVEADIGIVEPHP